MEIFGYSSELGKWMEVGNSGVFRPEMLRPMGLPEDVSTLPRNLTGSHSSCHDVILSMDIAM